MDFYARTDKLLLALDEFLIDRFDGLKSSVSFSDDKELSKKINRLYDEVYDIGLEWFTRLAQSVYADHKGGKTAPDRDWVQEILEDPDPVSKYSFVNEIDRRAARLYEAIKASVRNPNDEIDAAKRSMALAYHIYAVRVTDDAAVKAMKDSGVKKVKWIAEDDIHTCKVCHKLDNNIYPIDKIPPKPHINCRCWLVRVP